MMRLRSATILIGLASGSVLSQAPGRGRTIDEGTFSVTVAGVPQTENFKITRGDNGLITATGQLLAGPQQITSTLTADSVGTPVKYDFAIRNNGAQTLAISITALAGRLTALSYNQRGDQSMHEYPLAAGRCFILDDALVHQLYFIGWSKRANGPIELISPRESRTSRVVVTGKGLEPVSVGGRSLTATHYSLGEGPARREFWVDESGRLLRAEIPSRQLVAVREDPPR